MMRTISVLAAIFWSGCTSVMADTPECAAIKTTNIPFSVSAETNTTNLKDGKDKRTQTTRHIIRTGELDYHVDNIVEYSTNVDFSRSISTRFFYSSPLILTRFETLSYTPTDIINNKIIDYVYETEIDNNWYKNKTNIFFIRTNLFTNLFVDQKEKTTSKISISFKGVEKLDLFGCVLDVDVIHLENFSTSTNGDKSNAVSDVRYSPQLKEALIVSSRRTDVFPQIEMSSSSITIVTGISINLGESPRPWSNK